MVSRAVCDAVSRVIYNSCGGVCRVARRAVCGVVSRSVSRALSISV